MVKWEDSAKLDMHETEFQPIWNLILNNSILQTLCLPSSENEMRFKLEQECNFQKGSIHHIVQGLSYIFLVI